MARKMKKTDIVSVEKQDGQWLYEKDKLPWQVYLEAALIAGNRAAVDPMKQLLEFRSMCVRQAVDELTGDYGQQKRV